MPCYYTGSAEGDRALQAKEALDEMTSIACFAFSVLEEHNLLSTAPKAYRNWWSRHKTADRERVKKKF